MVLFCAVLEHGLQFGLCCDAIVRKLLKLHHRELSLVFDRSEPKENSSEKCDWARFTLLFVYLANLCQRIESVILFQCASRLFGKPNCISDDSLVNIKVSFAEDRCWWCHASGHRSITAWEVNAQARVVRNVRYPRAQLPVDLNSKAKDLERTPTQFKFVCHANCLVFDHGAQNFNCIGADLINALFEHLDIYLAFILGQRIPEWSQSSLFIVVSAQNSPHAIFILVIIVIVVCNVRLILSITTRDSLAVSSAIKVSQHLAKGLLRRCFVCSGAEASETFICNERAHWVKPTQNDIDVQIELVTIQ